MFAIWLPQIAAFLAGIVVTWAAQHQFTLSQTEVTAVFVAAFKFIELVIARWMNPGNVAASELVNQPKAEARSIRAMKKSRRSNVI
jgi:hypothetical protein